MIKTNEVAQVVLDKNDAEFLAYLISKYMAQGPANRTSHLIDLRDKHWGVQK